MELATGPLGSLLPKLAQLLHDKYKLHKGAREGIRFLCDELEIIHAALEKVGEVPIQQLDKSRRIWARNVRELSYDMEDIVDTYMVDVEGRPQPPSKRGIKHIIKKLKRKFKKTLARDEVAEEINDIMKRAKELADQNARYTIDDTLAAKKTTLDPRLIKALYTEATEIVGIEEAKDDVIKMLALEDGGQQKRIVSIAGFGGLGKTTLAKAVYEEIKGQFDCMAFVSVSRDPNTQKLLKDMLYQLDEKKFEDIHCKSLDETLLIPKAIEFLKNKRYLIVIDDIWVKEPWDAVIVYALTENNMRSRIITTTRNIEVAEHVGGCYKLKPLSEESSDLLFYGRIYGSKEQCPEEFLEVSKKIMKKCGGVPLAIITISSLLANKPNNITEWDNVCELIGSGHGSSDGIESMRKILQLSYYDLPSHLKTCLLYLSIFPEDYEIAKDRLIWRWVAEGFVQHDQQAEDQISFLEIGENYFNELLNRSMIQPADMDMDGTPHACRVHDTVLDLINSLSIEEGFITIVSGNRKHSLRSNLGIRRLSLHNYTTWPKTMNMQKLRSLTIFKPADLVIGSMPSLSCYHLLRVLDLGGYKLKDIGSLGFVGRLSHLRYLCLSSRYGRDATDELPVEIVELPFLQTLDISETNVKELPSSIVLHATQLRCLRVGGYVSGIRLPKGLENLTSLEVLEFATVTSECIAKELGHLTQLRVLKVRVTPLEDGIVSQQEEDDWMACTKALVGSLGKLNQLESLKIGYHSKYHELCLVGSLEAPLGNLRQLCIDTTMVVPPWIRPAWLPVLSFLDISVEYLVRADIQVLGMLPYLHHLRFKVMRPHVQEDLERCVVGPGAFPYAERCEFYTAGGVVPSTFPQGAMPKLQDFTLEINLADFHCGGESAVDDMALGHLKSLRSVTVVDRYGRRDRVKRAIKKLEREAAVHRNRPSIHFKNL